MQSVSLGAHRALSAACGASLAMERTSGGSWKWWRLLMMTEPRQNPILNERVKPALLNPVVKPITPSADILWVLLCVSLSLGIFALAYTLG
jgi:hypothetical protein